MGSRHPLLTALLVTLFVLDVASDVGTGIELILNDHYSWGCAVLGLVALPVVLAIVAEVLRGCIYGGCCGESTTDWIPLIFYHLYEVRETETLLIYFSAAGSHFHHLLFFPFLYRRNKNTVVEKRKNTRN